MGAIPESLKDINNVPSLTYFMGQTLVQKVNLSSYDDGGNPAHLPSASEAKEMTQWMRLSQWMSMVESELASVGTSQAIGTITSYLYAYADADAGTKKILLYSTKSISPYPLSAGQLVVYKNGALLSSSVEWSFAPTGITLETALVSGDSVEVIVLTPDLARGVSVHSFNGSTGTSTGNREWILADLGEDLQGGSITVFPTTAGRCWVHRNGVKQANTLDGTFSGTGVTAQWDFDGALTIADDEVITFIILGV